MKKQLEVLKKKVPADKVTGLLQLIETRWRMGPKDVGTHLGYSRQSVHVWKNSGAPQVQYAKLETLLQNGPGQNDPARNAPSPEVSNTECFLINLNLKIDILNPSDGVKAKVEKTIRLLESIRSSWV